MLVHPAILALTMGSVLVCLMLLASCGVGVRILRCWNIRSGSELQLILERRTYLISTVMAYALVFQLLSLFLFLYTADRLAVLFVGAMCAAGSLHANSWGYAALALKIVNFILAGLWLIINFLDNRGYDYPLIRLKCGLLILVAPWVVAETVLQTAYFTGLEPNVITSCCGTLFTSEAEGTASGAWILPPVPVETAYYSTVLLTLALGIRFHRSGRGLVPFTGMNAATFVCSVLALMSFVSLYIYELPTHHCPFCILQSEYGFIGYPLYLTILGGAVFGLGVAVVAPFRRKPSLAEIVPRIQKRLTLLALGCHAANVAVVLKATFVSNLRLHM